MNYQEEIDRALAAHGAWKARLKEAINNGGGIFSVEVVKTDNNCEFGKWYYALPEDIRSSPEALKVRELHALFHQEAANIIDLIKHGQKTQAEAALGYDEAYSRISGRLSVALSQWKNKF